MCYGAIALAAGLGIPIMAALNASLGSRLGSPVAAAVILFIVCLLLSTVVLLVVGLPSSLLGSIGTSAFHHFLGGVFVAFYVLSITWIVPRFGVGNAVFVVLLGQLISATVIDHFALFGSLRVSASGTRLMGLVLMGVGVLLSQRTASPHVSSSAIVRAAGSPSRSGADGS